MGCTICYDILIKQAKATKLIAKAEPPEKDKELEDKVEAEKNKYRAQADAIYNEQKGILEAKYKADIAAIDAQKKVWETEYMNKRFESTNTEEYTEEGIRTSLDKELDKLMNNKESLSENLLKSIEEAGQKTMEKAEDSIKKGTQDKLNKLNEKRNRKLEKQKNNDNSDSNKIKDLEAAASEIGKGTDKDIDALEESYKNAKDSYEKLVRSDAKSAGEQKGAKMVQEFNNKIAKQAKQQFEAAQDAASKAMLEMDKAIQTAKLQIFGKLGV